MAGDWIPMRLDLYEDPAVTYMAERIGQREEVVVGYLHRIWAWASRQSQDGCVKHVTLTSLGRVTSLPDFPQLMADAGWLEHGVDTDGKPYISFPNWDRWLGESAKKRISASRRKQKERVTEMSQKVVTNVTEVCDKSVTTVEESTEEKSKKEEEPPLSPKGESAEEQTAVGEPPKEPPPADVPPEPSPQFPECVRDICEEWLEYKRQRNHKYKPMGLKKLVTQVEKALTKYGPEVVRDGIEKAIANNYQGWTFCVSKQQPASKPVTFAQQAQANMAAIISKAAAADAAAGRITGQQALLEGYSE